jgi:hypothetical protein
MTDTSWLDELAPATVNVEITLPGGRKHTLTIGTLSHAEWEDAGAAIKEPKVPYTKFKAGTDELIANPEDPAYLAELAKTGERRGAYRMARHFEKAGKVIPGDTPIEKADAILKMDQGVYRAIFNLLVELNNAKREVLEDAASSFRGEPIPANGDAGA